MVMRPNDQNAVKYLLQTFPYQVGSVPFMLMRVAALAQMYLRLGGGVGDHLPTSGRQLPGAFSDHSSSSTMEFSVIGVHDTWPLGGSSASSVLSLLSW